MPTRYYLHKPDIRMDLLQRTDNSSSCPYKGRAHYWSVTVGDRVIDDLAWGYGTPLLAIAKVTGLVCFYNEKLDIVADGKPQERPVISTSMRQFPPLPRSVMRMLPLMLTLVIRPVTLAPSL